MAMLMFCTICSAQDFSYYIEIDKKLTLTTNDNFEKSIDHHINVDVYLENDKKRLPCCMCASAKVNLQQ